jgi:hypothetical protein
MLEAELPDLAFENAWRAGQNLRAAGDMYREKVAHPRRALKERECLGPVGADLAVFWTKKAES